MGEKVAMILAAGRGERMMPLTANTPKPLLKVANHYLIEHTINHLTKAGCQRIVINCAYLGEQIPKALGDGSSYGITLQYSMEESALETAGGIIQALNLLNCDEFIVCNADIWCNFDFEPLFNKPLSQDLAHLVMVDNPPQHPEGDFLLHNGRIKEKDIKHSCGLTFSGIGKYKRAMFDNLPHGKRALRPLFTEAIHQDKLSGEHFCGQWHDIGTPDRLASLQKAFGC